MIPLHMKTSEFRASGEETYYLVAANGTFLVKNMGFYSASVRIDANDSDFHKEEVTLNMRRLPHSFLSAIFGFFKVAYLWHRGEAIVILYYNTNTGDFRAVAPPQRVTRIINGSKFCVGTQVSYDACSRPAGFIKLGSAHSHANGPSYHSHTDNKDERYDDGLHITFGSVHTAQPDLSFSFVVNGRRFMLDPEDIAEGYGSLVPLRPPAEWVAQITCIDEYEYKIVRKKLRYERNDTTMHSA